MKKNLLSSLMLFAAATLFVSCVDPAPEPTPPTPPDPPVPTTDVVLAPKFAVGSYNEDGKKEGYANFNLALSEVKGTYELEFEAAGKALVLNLYAPISETMDLPVGKYTSLTDVATVAGPSVVTNLTNGLTIDAEKKNTKTHSFKSMELEVARTGDTYTITFNGMTTGDTKYTCIYTGKLDMTDITAEPEPDPDPVLTNVVTYQVTAPGQPAFYILEMTDCTLDKDGNPTSAGTQYTVYLYSAPPTDAVNWRPAAGVYDAAGWVPQNEPNTFYTPASTVVSIVETGGKFEANWDTSLEMQAGAITIAHVGENNFTAALDVKLGAAGSTDVGTPLKLTATDFKRVNKNVDPEPEPEPEPAIVITKSKVTYHGGDVTSNYVLNMITCTVDENGKPTSVGTMYAIDLYSTLPNDPAILRPAEGKYTWTKGEPAASNFTRSGSLVTPITLQDGQFLPDLGVEVPIVYGTVTITHEGEKGFVAVVDVEKAGVKGNEPVKFTANNFELIDESGGESDQTNFTGNVVIKSEASVSQVNRDAFSDDATAGTKCWIITLGYDYEFKMMIYTASTSDSEIPVGTFAVGEDGAANTFAPGFYMENRMEGTGYQEYKVPHLYAAIIDGEITITKEENGEYTVVIDVIDELMNEFTGEWTGKLEVQGAPGSAPRSVKRR